MVGASKWVPRTELSAGTAAPDARGGARAALPNRAWAGRGSGAVCDLCHQTIDEDQIEYEIELSAAHHRVLTLHLDCYEQWALSGESVD